MQYIISALDIVPILAAGLVISRLGLGTMMSNLLAADVDGDRLIAEALFKLGAASDRFGTRPVVPTEPGTGMACRATRRAL